MKMYFNVIIQRLFLSISILLMTGILVDAQVTTNDTIVVPTLLGSDFDYRVNTEALSFYNSRTENIIRTKPNHLLASSMVAGSNLMIWGFDRFILDAEYARINFKTIKRNFQNGFTWDNDLFSTNLIAHPYHGNLYFTAARSSSVGFWKSIPYAMAGSAMWEFAMENKQPSINDFVATTIGGVGLGEMLFRISDVFIDNRMTGLDRAVREVGVFAVSPMRGISRLINGESTSHQTVRGNMFSDKPMSFNLAGGYRFLEEETQGRTDIGNMFCFDMSFIYGTPFETVDNQPYNFFTFTLSGNLSAEQPAIGRLSLLGQIAAHEIYLSNPKHNLSLGVFQHFNYYTTAANSARHTQPFKLSETASVGLGSLYKYDFGRDSGVFISLHLSAILLGGSQTDYYRFSNRDYNLGSGFSSKFQGAWRFRNKLQIGIDVEDYRLYSWLGNDPLVPDGFKPEVQGDISSSSLSVFYGNVSYNITEKFFVAAESSMHFRRSDYKFFPTVEHRIAGQRFSVGARF